MKWFNKIMVWVLRRRIKRYTNTLIKIDKLRKQYSSWLEDDELQLQRRLKNE